MSRARTLADLLDSSGDVKSANLDNVAITNLSSTTSGIDVTGTVTADGLTLSSGTDIKQDDTASSIVITGGNASNVGANMLLYGSTHATNANIFRIRQGAVERLRITSTGNVEMGGDLDVTGSVTADTMDVEDNIVVREFATKPEMILQRAQGTKAVPTPVANGQTIGKILFKGYTTSGAYRTGAEILAGVTEGISGDEMPSSIFFRTTPNGSTTSVERMVVSSTGNVGIGTSSPESYYSSNLVVSGGSEGGITIVGGTSDSSYLSFADGTSGTERYRGMIGYNHGSNSLDLRTNSIVRLTISSTGNVGLGVTPESWSGSWSAFQFGDAGVLSGRSDSNGVDFGNNFYYNGGWKYFKSDEAARLNIANGKYIFQVSANGSTPTADSAISWTTAMTIGNDGIVKVGASFTSSAMFTVSSASSNTMALNRSNSDGVVLEIRNDGSTVGTMGVSGADLFIAGNRGTNSAGIKFTDQELFPVTKTGATQDNAIDIGHSASRFDDIYATNGTIQTSDRNEKQDIEELTEAEQRVAVGCKGLMRKFKWKSAVAEKGVDARIHFGIIAQDLQDAFTAEGLDAGRYAMFISTTWWEIQTEVPAVEAVAEELDEDGNGITEAVEAQEAYTRTDIFNTPEEAPEGATDRNRLGVRYPELLAFIISAI